MAGYSPWKELERRHAKRLNGKRLWRPDFSESMPDGENERETWDAKAYLKFRIHTIFEECERKYRAFTGDRNFHLVLFCRERKAVGDLVVCRAARYAELLEKEALLDSHVAAFISTTGTEPRTGRIIHGDNECVCGEINARHCPEHQS